VSGIDCRVVEKSMLDGKAICPGDAVIGLASERVAHQWLMPGRKYFKQMRLSRGGTSELRNTFGD